MILAHRILKQEDCCELQASPRVHNGTLSQNTKKEKGREGKKEEGRKERKESRAVYLWVSVPYYPGIEEGRVKARNWGTWSVRRVKRVLGREQRP